LTYAVPAAMRGRFILCGIERLFTGRIDIIFMGIILAPMYCVDIHEWEEVLE
jgi:hypothetical protein